MSKLINKKYFRGLSINELEEVLKDPLIKDYYAYNQYGSIILAKDWIEDLILKKTQKEIDKLELQDIVKDNPKIVRNKSSSIKKRRKNVNTKHK